MSGTWERMLSWGFPLDASVGAESEREKGQCQHQEDRGGPV